MKPPRQVRKRDGRLVPFDRWKIAEAIFRAAQSVGGEDRFLAEQLAGVVVARLQGEWSGSSRSSAAGAGTGAAASQGGVPTIELVQDLVERVLIDAGHARTAKAYILYRERRAEARAARFERLPGAGGVADESATNGGSGTMASAGTGSARSGSARSGSGPGQARPAGAAKAGAAQVGGRATKEGAPATPLIGGDAWLENAEGAQDLRRWSKSEVTERLVREMGLDRAAAEQIARAIEERLLRARVPRVPEQLLDTLVRAELFERGWTARAARPREAGPTSGLVAAALGTGPEEAAGTARPADRLTLDPSDLTESIGEAVVAQHVLDHLLPAPVSEAFRVGDLHLYDLGAPLRLSAIALSTPLVAPRYLEGQRFSRAGGVRRAFATVEAILLRHAPHAARVLALEDLNVWLAPYVAHLSEDALAEEVRQFLLSPALSAVDRRGGLLRMELGLSAEIPRRLARVETTEPAPPGRCYGDYADAALHVTRTFLREANELRRSGHWIDCALTLVLNRAVPKGQPGGKRRDASQRALIRQALAAAGEGGEPVMVFDDESAPSRGSRWLRLRESEVPDPLRFDHGDVSAAGAVAINLVGAALRTRKAGLNDFLGEVDRLVRLALDAASTHRDQLGACGGAPGGALYALRRGVHPLVDLEASFYLVEIVGADRAAALLLSESESIERLGMRERLLRHVHGRVREEALARRLCASVAEGLLPEAAARFARCDAQRYPLAASWWPAHHEPSYGASSPAGPGLIREPLHPDRLKGGPSLLRVRHRVGGDRHPPVEDLLTALEAAEKDTAVLEYAVDPWPRRLVHREEPP